MASFHCLYCNITTETHVETDEYYCRQCKSKMNRVFKKERYSCRFTTKKDKIQFAKLIDMPYSKLDIIKLWLCDIKENIINFKNKRIYNLYIVKKTREFSNKKLKRWLKKEKL